MSIPIRSLTSEGHGGDEEEIALLHHVFGTPREPPPPHVGDRKLLRLVALTVIFITLSLPVVDRLIRRWARGDVSSLAVKVAAFIVLYVIVEATLVTRR